MILFSAFFLDLPRGPRRNSDSMIMQRKSSRAPSRAHSDQGKQSEDRPGDESGGSDPIKVVS